MQTMWKYGMRILSQGMKSITGLQAAATSSRENSAFMHPEILRRFLSENGFAIIAESLVRDDKIYQIICAEYTGATYRLTPMEQTFGRLNIAERSPLLYELFDHTERVMTDRIRGKEQASADTSEEEYFLKEMEKLK